MYVEEVDGSETQQIQAFPASQSKIGEKVRLATLGDEATVDGQRACGVDVAG